MKFIGPRTWETEIESTVLHAGMQNGL
jgi:hypothetical protein